MREKIKILLLAANPKDTARLRLDQEYREIEHKILLAQKKDQLILVNKGAVRIGDLQFYLNQERPTIVHFSGQGTTDGRIILEDNFGKAKPVPPRALERMVKVLKDNIRCVVLNACFSIEQARALSRHIDCVIGMSSLISDDAAIAFSAAFYLAIASGRSMKNAFDQGINELMLWEIPEEHVPQLLIRNNMEPSDIFLLEAETPTTLEEEMPEKPLEPDLNMLTAEERAMARRYRLKEYFERSANEKYLLYVMAAKVAADKISNLEADRVRNKFFRATELYLEENFKDDEGLYGYVDHIHTCLSDFPNIPEEIWERICCISSKIVVRCGWGYESKK